MAAALIFLILAAGAPAQAGHFLVYYPSFYPQEVRIKYVDPGTASARLQTSSVHALIGVDPFANTQTLSLPAGLGRVDSLRSYIVLTFDGTSAGLADGASRCAFARAIIAGLQPPPPGLEVFPYPVTPYHADYLSFFDLIASWKKTIFSAPPVSTPPSGFHPRLHAPGRWQALVHGAAQVATGLWDATIEEVQLDDLLADSVSTLWAPPWQKEGWFQAYLLLAGALRDRVVRDRADVTFRRLTEGRYRDGVEKINLERKLVTLLTGGCDRVVLGYTLRREYYSTEYYAGIENIAFDSQGGLNSSIFIRTAKLKDFPWNGSLQVGITRLPTAAWNPVAGFTDPFGKFLWATIADPALMPGPYSSTWIPYRVEWTGGPDQGSQTPGATPARMLQTQLPPDALRPVAGTGTWQRVGPGQTAAGKLTYRVQVSSFHDGTGMTVADALYPLAFAMRRSGASAGSSTADADQSEHATRTLQTWVAAIKFLGTEEYVRNLFDVKLRWQIPVVEVYLTHAPPDLQTAAVVAPPWSPIPWHVWALMDAAASRGIAAFTAHEAQRRKIPWLDLVRDRVVLDRLARLVGEFERTGYRPPEVQPFVTAAEAQQRWGALRQFYQQHHHFLVTNGPYRLDTWSPREVVLEAFRDLSYPVTIGAFDRFAVPRRGFVSRVTPRQEGLDVDVDVERLLKFQRSYNIVREPISRDSSAGLDRLTAVCQYVVVGADGQVSLAGVAADQGKGVFRVALGPQGPQHATVFVAAYVNDNSMNPEVREVVLGDQ